MKFRRYYLPGSAVFITQVVQDRRFIFEDRLFMNLLRDITHHAIELHSFNLLGNVFLPDHFHLIFQPTGESNFSYVMHSIKPHFTREYKKHLRLSSSEPLKLWQKRFWDHVIRDDRDFENHLHYMHFNPVKHGFVKDPRDWKDSSYIEWEEKGLYSANFKWDEPKKTEWGE